MNEKIVVYPDLASTEAVWQFIDYKIKKHNIPRKVINRIKICTDEVYSNILRYSNATQAEISCQVEKRRMTIIFRDNGLAFDPTRECETDVKAVLEEGNTSGIGIVMIQKTATAMSYQYENHQNVLTLMFDLCME